MTPLFRTITGPDCARFIAMARERRRGFRERILKQIMKQQINDGGPAFPIATNWNTDTAAGGNDRTTVTKYTGGISVRDHFAAKAMNGILSNPSTSDNITVETIDWISSRAYRIADAMLKARGTS